MQVRTQNMLNSAQPIPRSLPGNVTDRLRNLKNLIGNTPLLALHFRLRGQPRVLYAKAENLNLTGSIKDRMAFYILRQAYQARRIQPGDTIVEATSGNTGISFAALGRALGHDVIIFMPDWLSEERAKLIRSLGAQVIPVSHTQGGFLRSRQPNIRLHPVEPAESPTLSIGHKVGHHRIQGISDEFIPALVELDSLDEVLAVHDGDAILMAQKLAGELGLGVGISSGAN